MGEAGWKPDPTGRHAVRYFDGESWSAHVSDLGVQTTDPFEAADDVSATASVETVLPSEHPAAAPSRRRWPWVVAIVGALVIGIGIGAASQSGTVDDLKAKLTSAQHERDVAVTKVNARESQRRVNLAKAAATRARLAQAEQRKKAAADAAAKAAADKAAADAAAQQKAAADAFAAAAANAARMGTIDTDGVYAIGADKTPGRYHTDGGADCYYAILNSPDTQDIATNNIVTGPTYADLPAGKFFETTRCGTWTKV